MKSQNQEEKKHKKQFHEVLEEKEKNKIILSSAD